MLMIDESFIIDGSVQALGWCVGHISELGTFYLHSDGQWRDSTATEAEDGTLVYSGYYPDKANSRKRTQPVSCRLCGC